jgi:hypothetical protein
MHGRGRGYCKWSWSVWVLRHVVRISYSVGFRTFSDVVALPFFPPSLIFTPTCGPSPPPAPPLFPRLSYATLNRYRGIELEALLDLKPVELTKLFPARLAPLLLLCHSSLQTFAKQLNYWQNAAEANNSGRSTFRHQPGCCATWAGILDTPTPRTTTEDVHTHASPRKTRPPHPPHTHKIADGAHQS